jgi:hypothetical protein
VATVIDALVVTLGLDAKDYKAGSDKARKSLKDTSDEADRTAKNMEARGKQAAEFFGKLRNEALALLAVFTAGVGIKNFVENTVTSASNLGRLSDNLGITTERLMAYQRAAERMGGTQEGMVSQLKESSNAVASFKAGMMTESTGKSFFYGLKQEDLKDGESYLLARSKIIAEIYKTDKPRAALVANQMGISEEQFNLLKQGPEAFLALVKAQEKHSAISRQDAAMMDRLRTKYLDFKDTMTDVAQSILIKLAPSLEKILAKFEQLAAWVESHKKDIGGWLDGAIKGVSDFFAALNRGDYDNEIKSLKALAGAFAEVAVAIGGAIKTFSDWTNRKAPSSDKVKQFGPLTFGKKDDLDAEDEKNGRASTNGRRFASGKITKGDQSSRQQQLVTALKGDGYNDAQAAGIVGSLMQESQLDPRAVNPKSGATGIAQWLGPRKKQFEKNFGHSLKDSTFEEQTQFMLWEMKNTHKAAGDMLKKAGSAEVAAQIHSQHYEIPDPKEANIGQRQKNAVKVLAHISDEPEPRNSAPKTVSRLEIPEAKPTSSDYPQRKSVDVLTQTSDTGIKSPVAKQDDIGQPQKNAVRVLTQTSNDPTKPAPQIASSVVDRSDIGQRQKNAADVLAMIGRGNAAATANMVGAVRQGGRSVTTNNSNTEVSIGKIEIKTAATDANGLSRDLSKSLSNITLASQANTGLQ